MNGAETTLGSERRIVPRLRDLASRKRLVLREMNQLCGEPFIAGIELPDKNDRHVVAAAIRGNADAIVSMNTKDFPPSVLSRFDLELQTPDQFVLNQIMLHPPIAFTAIKRMRLRWERPSFTASDMVDLFEKRHLVQTAAHLRDVLELI